MQPLIRRDDNGYRAQAQELLRQWIVQGRFAPGERLNEVSLARELGISRGPLREALQRLDAAGFVTIVSHRGAFVRTFNRREITDLFELRVALEETASGLAAERITDQEADELQSLVSEISAQMATSESSCFPEGIDLHSRIATLSRNSVLASHLAEVHAHLALARVTSGNQPDRAHVAQAEHEAIVAAIVERDRMGARERMADHLRHAMTNALRSLLSPSDTRNEE
ncbi:DNA-binding GntR family transcriptional regulator [Tamaricihabitans halophyticus]|uniref:DNA-binding GntR family transcriptional regulator n=1 Tax=Tamaricihabitans halophyticus TaxID=1262583 RepID=A0A4R2QZX0_9PSEU|nr:GntR family transcriptional regulator [Tamaricihabitans halophyticus]TCP55257.1 DNA-binding GntR family transcriptional regulator [Tamaricihabitans halophyticus]